MKPPASGVDRVVNRGVALAGGVFALLLFAYAGFLVSRAFGGDGDSSAAVYLAIAALIASAGLLILGASALLLSERPRPLPWLLIALAALAGGGSRPGRHSSGPPAWR